MMAGSLTESLRETREVFDESGPPLTTTEVADAVDVGRRSAYERLDRLVERGDLETKKVGASARVWWRPRTPASATGSGVESSSAAESSSDMGPSSAAESSFEPLFDRISDGFYGLDDRLRFTYVNETAARLLGVDADRVVGRSIHEELPMTDAFENELREALDAQEPVVLEDYYEPLEGWFENRIYSSESGLSVYFRDVTESKERERTLEETRRRHRTLVENFPNGAVAVVDDSMRYVTFGGAPEGDTDVSRHEIEGEPVREVLPEQLAETVAPHYEAALDGESTRFERELGGRIYQFQFTPIRDDDGEVFAALGLSQDVTERTERERQLERQREQLAALNDLHAVVREITDEVIDRSTREEIEAVVCDRLAASDSHLVAWIGEFDVATQTATVRTAAGVDESTDALLEGTTVSVDPDDDGGWLVEQAALRGEVRTSHDVGFGTGPDPLSTQTELDGVRASAAVPIVHEGSVYGVLTVSADRPTAFEGDERTVFAQLGEVVGHVIAATERKRALLSDEMVELEFRIRDVVEAMGAGSRVTGDQSSGRISFEHAVPLGDDAFVVYGYLEPDGIDHLEGLVDAIPHWSDVTIRDGGETPRFELHLSGPPILSTVASLGGSIRAASIEDGDYRMTVHLAPGTDVRRLIETVQSTYPGAELLTQRQVDRRDDSPGRDRSDPTGDLTDRQRAALEAAFHAGFYEWPRAAAAETVADSLGVAPATFHQHLRKAHRKVFESVLPSARET